MNLFLIGSTGMIGSRIAREARDRGHQVTEATRSGGDGRLELDVHDTDAVAGALPGHDVLVSAVAPPRDGTDASGPLVAAGRSLLDAVRASDVERLLVVGGAGSLLLADGTRNVDQDDFPAEYRGEALAHADLLAMLRDEADDVAWAYLSPAGMIQPGERTGEFTLGGDELVVDNDGQSQVSAEDYAVALVDEVEEPAHTGERFTLGYA